MYFGLNLHTRICSLSRKRHKIVNPLKNLDMAQKNITAVLQNSLFLRFRLELSEHIRVCSNIKNVRNFCNSLSLLYAYFFFFRYSFSREIQLSIIINLWPEENKGMSIFLYFCPPLIISIYQIKLRYNFVFFFFNYFYLFR